MGSTGDQQGVATATSERGSSLGSTFVGWTARVSRDRNRTALQIPPQTAELVKAVNELAKWYASHRVALVSLIFSHHTGEIRTYPDMDRGTEEEK